MKVTPLNNYVLLTVDSDNSKIKLKDGKVLFFDKTFAKERNSDVVCKVVAVPDSLIYGTEGEYNPKTGGRQPITGSMDWDTDMELKVGDTVITHYMAYVTAFGDDKKVFIIDGVEYFLCPYGQIYLAKRRWTKTEENVFWATYDQMGVDKKTIQSVCDQNGIVIKGSEIYSVIMLNGYVLVQPLEKELKSSLIDLPDSIFGNKHNKRKVAVRFVGKPNRQYISGVYSDSTNLSPGDTVLIDKFTDIPLEAQEHRTFNGDQAYWRVQNCLIHGKCI